MSGFLRTAFGFPTLPFTMLLLVVIGYWLLAITGIDGFDTEADLLGLVGLRGLPVSILLSLFVSVTWFASLAGSVGYGGHPLVALAAPAVGWTVTRMAARPLRRLLPDVKAPGRLDFVGRMCVVRTGRVTGHFGQAEVRAEDGSAALVQVRQRGLAPLQTGSSALIFDYDARGEFFWVMPYDAALDPHLKEL